MMRRGCRGSKLCYHAIDYLIGLTKARRTQACCEVIMNEQGYGNRFF